MPLRKNPAQSQCFTAIYLDLGFDLLLIYRQRFAIGLLQNLARGVFTDAQLQANPSVGQHHWRHLHAQHRLFKLN